MASPGELVRVVAERLGVPESAVTQHDRNLVQAGRRTKGGRGRSAAKVTPADAAGLLIAVTGSSYIKDSIETLDEFGGLRVHAIYDGGRGVYTDRKEDLCWRLPGMNLPHLQDLPATHTFLEAIASLIASMADGAFDVALSNFISRVHKQQQSLGFINFLGEIQLFSPNPQAVIRIQTPEWTEEVHYANNLPQDGQDLHKWQAEFERTAHKGDLRQTRTFSFRTLVDLGACLSR